MKVQHFAAIAAFLALSPHPEAQCRVTALVASDPVPYGWFGLSIDRSGSRLVVGAPTADHLGLESGVAYLFEDTPAGWVGALAGSAYAFEKAPAGWREAARPIVAGVTRVFQAWFLDPVQGGTGFNSSDARRVTFGQ